MTIVVIGDQDQEIGRILAFSGEEIETPSGIRGFIDALLDIIGTEAS